MRTDLMKLSVVALAAALAAPRAAGAQEVTAPRAAPAAAPAAPTPPALPAAPRVVDTLSPAVAPPAPLAAPPGSQISLNGYSVPHGKVVDGDVVVPFGDVRVAGEVMGDVTVGKGNLVLLEGGVIHGNAVVSGGQLLNHGGRVFGEMRVNSDEYGGDGEMAAAEAAAEAERNVEVAEHIHVRHRGFWGSVGEGIEGIVSTLTLGLILCLIGAALVFYALPQLERVSGTIRRDTARSAGVGIAANFLSLPAFFIGLVVLLVTIIGIPLLVLYVPLFWVALVAAGTFGVVAAGHAIGERTAEQSGEFSTIRRNAYSYTFTGIAMLLAPMFAGHLLQLTGFLGWLGSMVNALGVLILWVAATVGFGAVVLTRAGTRPGWPWKRGGLPYDPIFDEEPAFDRSGAHV
ncbi:MAG: hypothetical protein ACJ8GN_26635 [Longimicrobiaceae bacterium]